MQTWEIINGDCLDVLRTMQAESVQVCVTSPPYYGLRDYNTAGQIGLEKTPELYVERLVAVFEEVRRVLRTDGTLWLNLGDSYAASYSNNGGYSDKSTLAGFSKADTKGRIANDAAIARRLRHGVKEKNLLGIPWRVAFALQNAGWYLRQDIIWHKPNPMPESVRDRCTKSHEYLFLLSKSPRYFFDSEAIQEPFADSRNGNPNGGGHYARAAFGEKRQTGLQIGVWNADGRRTGKNRRSVWTIATGRFKEAHFATFPPDLVRPCVLAGSRPNDLVLDPFAGAGTTGVVALETGRRFVGVELNAEYIDLAKSRIANVKAVFAKVVSNSDKSGNRV